MLTFLRRFAPILASLTFTAVSGCTLPDRPPTLADGGPSSPEDGGVGDGSRGDVSLGDVSLGDTSLVDTARGDVASDLSVRDGLDVSVIDGPGRDSPITTIDVTPPDAPTVCIPGGSCLPANPCHQGELECSDSGGTTCRDTTRSQTNGAPCDKGVCLDGTCQACAAGTMCDVANKPCRVGTIVCSTGAPVCTETDNKPNGATCGSGLVCQEGACKPCVTGEACTPTNACHAGRLDCSAAMPTCNDTGVAVPSGASCGQDKVCNSAGTCVACVAGSACTAAGNVCRSGTIACSTGAPVCIESGNTTDGTSCGTDKVCSGGACVACSPGLACVPGNPCHAGKTVCSPAVSCTDTGMNLMDGANCGTDKVCSGGVCSTCADGKDCATTNPCKTGKTSCATGVSVCNETGDQQDGFACGTNQVCSKGVCGVCNNGASCPPTNPCHTGTLSCSTGTPVCNDTGTSLMDGVGCGMDLVCRGGMCITCKAGGGCQPTDLCKTGTYSCATGSQVCVVSGNKSTGAECDSGKVCNSAGICDVCNNGGTCTPTSNRCHKGTLSCTTGTGVCVDSGTNQDNGTNCGTNSVCFNGMCGSCTDGATCTSQNGSCKNAAYVCSTGQPVCTDTGNKASGTPCGMGQTCSAGRVTGAQSCNSSGACASPTPTQCTSNACSGNNCLDCGGAMACNGACCAANTTCCSNRCVTLNSNDNCGVCGNACVVGKTCSGTQCLWEDGHTCGGPLDCASGVCGGRCCAAGTTCTCTQPTAGNQVKNPGFDTGLGNWIVGVAPVSWVSNSSYSDQFGNSGDAQKCPYSGAARLSCNEDGTQCGAMWQCIPVTIGSQYALGVKMLAIQTNIGGETHCDVETYPGASCSGTPTVQNGATWVNVRWPSIFLEGTFVTGPDVSARIHCYQAVGGEGLVDMVYLTNTTVGTRY